MAHLQHPLLGDPLYGGRSQSPAAADARLVEAIRGFGRQALHAERLGFTHPRSREPFSIEAPPPPDFTEAGTGEQRNFRFVPVGIKVGEEVVPVKGSDFGGEAYERTLKDYAELRESLFPGTAPEL